MTRTEFAQLLDEYHPYILKHDNLTDLKPALDGGYQPHWSDPAPVRHGSTAKRPSFWRICGDVSLAVLGLMFVFWAALMVFGGI